MSQDETVNEVLDRGARTFAGVSPIGARPPWETLADVAPALGEQAAMAFGSVLSRPGLDARTRELLSICMLAAMGGSEAQVAFHVGAALRAGAAAPEIMEALTQVSVFAGVPRALNAAVAARGALTEVGADPAAPAPRTVALDFLAAVARRDWAAAGGLVAAGATFELPGTPGEAAWSGSWSGAIELIRLRSAIDAAVTQFSVHDVLTQGALILVRATAALHDPATPGQRAQPVVLELSVEDGRISAVRGYGRALPATETARVAVPVAVAA